jgi:hypothetical protein
MSQVQQASSVSSRRQLYEITRSEATWLIKIYKKALKKAAENDIEPYRVFRDALETQKPAYLGRFNNSQNAVVQGTFYAMASHIFEVTEQLFKQHKNMNHDAKVNALCKHLPTSKTIAYNSISCLNWAVFNWHRKDEFISEDFDDYYCENTTCAICDFKGETVFYFSTVYGLEQPVCEKCVCDEEELEDTKDGEYVVEEEEVSYAENEEAEASEADVSEAEEDEAEASEAEASEAEASEAEASDPEASDPEEDEAEEDGDGEDPLDKDYTPSESEDSESDLSDAASSDSEDERTFGCAGCPYEWRAGFKHGYKAAMKEMRNYADKQKNNLPTPPQCEVCEDSHENLKKCSRCRSVRYCSTKCQSEDWPNHKLVCRAENLYVC